MDSPALPFNAEASGIDNEFLRGLMAELKKGKKDGRFYIGDLDAEQTRGLAATALFTNSKGEISVDHIKPEDLQRMYVVRDHLKLHDMSASDRQAFMNHALANLAIAHEPGVRTLWYRIKDNHFVPIFLSPWVEPGVAEQQSQSLRESRGLSRIIFNETAKDELLMHSRQLQVGYGVAVIGANSGLRYVVDMSADIHDLILSLTHALGQKSAHGQLLNLVFDYDLFGPKPKEKPYVDMHQSQNGLIRVMAHGQGLAEKLCRQPGTDFPPAPQA